MPGAVLCWLWSLLLLWLPQVLQTQALALPRAELAVWVWIALAGLPRSGTSVHGPWRQALVATCLVAPGILALQALDGSLWQGPLTGWLLGGLFCVAAERARSETQTLSRYAVLWIGLALVWPLLVATLELYTDWTPGGWVQGIRSLSPIQWAWDLAQGRDTLPLMPACLLLLLLLPGSAAPDDESGAQ